MAPSSLFRLLRNFSSASRSPLCRPRLRPRVPMSRCNRFRRMMLRLCSSRSRVWPSSETVQHLHEHSTSAMCRPIVGFLSNQSRASTSFCAFPDAPFWRGPITAEYNSSRASAVALRRRSRSTRLTELQISEAGTTRSDNGRCDLRGSAEKNAAADTQFTLEPN